MQVDPSTIVTAIRARSHERFVRALGARPSTTLGTGNAVFLGGIWLIAPNGEEQALRAGPSIWIWPALLAALGAGLVGVLAVVVEGPWWLKLSAVTLFALIFVSAALAALVLARSGSRRRLVVDTRRRTLDEVVGGRAMLSVPADQIQALRIQRYENSDDEVRNNVLVRVGSSELWIHQGSSDEEDTELARTIAEALGVRFEPEVEHVR